MEKGAHQNHFGRQKMGWFQVNLECVFTQKTRKVKLLTHDLTRHFFVRHTLSEMENFKYQFNVAY